MTRLTRWIACGMLTLGVSAVFTTGQAPQFPSLKPLHVKAPEFPTAETGLGHTLSTSPQPSPRTSGPEPGPEQAPVLGSEASLPGPAWINSPPLAMAGLRGKVVLIDFWEYTCINCIRTFPANKKWYERYHKYGFEIIGVHDPEFDIAYPVEHVRTAVKRFGLPYPIVVDDQFKIWRSYNNSTWPNRFLVDAKGLVRFNRSGEGADSEFEQAIQYLLQEAHRGLKFPASTAIPREEEAFGPGCGIPTAEMYVGDWDGRGILANPEGYRLGKTLKYQMPAAVEDGRAAVSGAWATDKNGMIYRGKPRKGGPYDDKLEMRYHARELYAVMNVEHGHPSRLFIQQDGKDLTPQNKGADVQLDSSGRSWLEVREPRMYYLVQNPSFGQYSVSLTPTAPGLTINSFTFGNNCQTQFPHL